MVNVTLNRRNIRNFLKSPEVQRALHQEAKKVAERAGEGWGVEDRVGTRARSYVRPLTVEAMVRQAKHHVLERAVGGQQ